MRRILLLLICLTLLPLPALAEKTIVLTFTGDVTLGSEERTWNQDTSFVSVAAEKGYDYFFAKVKHLFAQDDLTIINMEGVLSDSKSSEDKKKVYRFRGPTEFGAIFEGASIEAATIANNHSMDFGSQGFKRTQETLEKAGIVTFGFEDVYIYEKDGIKIAFMGMSTTKYNGTREWTKKELKRLREQEGVNAIVYVFHGGREYFPTRNDNQNRAGKFSINYGADLVIMHHPHVVQGLAVYKNRSICYSLGNFCFGGNSEVRAMEAMVVQATLTFSDEGEYLGQQLKLYPVHVSGSYPVNDYQPRFVTGEDAAKAMELAQADSDFQLNPFDDELGYALQDYVPAVSEEDAK